MIKVSVIVPIYNVEPYLKRCLDCLVNQTLKDVEFILIDDCSTDNSLAIAREYAQNDKRINLIELKQNQGAAVARNKGLEVAKGEYLGFVDPDDAIDLNYYEELYKKANETDADIVKCVRETIQTNGIHKISNLNETIKSKSNICFYYEWQTAIYKSSMIFENNINFPPKVIKAQDVVFLNRAVIKTKILKLIDNVKYYYYLRDDSLNAKKISFDKIKSALLAYEYIINDCNKALNIEITEQDYLTKYYFILICILNHTITQNDSIYAKKLCIKKFIEYYNKCKLPEELQKLFCNNLKDISHYVLENNTDKLTEIFIKYENLQNYFISQIRNNVRADLCINHS